MRLYTMRTWFVCLGLLPMLMAGMLVRPAVAEDALAACGELQSAPANTWVKILQTETGGRDQPAFVYAGKLGRFVIATGMQATGGPTPRHYDVEELDLAACQWTNAYPPGLAAGRPVTGPVSEEYTKQRTMQGNYGPQLFYKDGDQLRVGAGGQWLKTKTYGEYCYVPDAGALYVYLWDKTLRYDVAKRTWTDLETEPRSSCRIWGSLCYDPIHQEILHAGGDGGSAEIGTWIYSIERNQWRKLSCGSAAMNQLAAQAEAVRRQAKELVGGVASRYAQAETPAESQVDLADQAKQLTAELGKLAAEAIGAELAPHEQAAGKVGSQRLRQAQAALEQAGPALSENLSPAKIAAIRSVRVLVEQAADALRAEPVGRARSQLAYDPQQQKIVLFGGDHLDRTLSDTWIYDCQTRVWEQRFPSQSPPPRAGHILAWLPRGKQLVMAGGYGRTPLPQQIWTYDVPTNRWTALLNIPLVRERHHVYSPGVPETNNRTVQFGAVNDEDVLVCPVGNTVWACKIDVGRSSESLTAELAVSPGSYEFNPIDPATWEAAAAEPAPARQALNQLPANQWTSLSFPLYAPGAGNRWGTSAYDTDRHQFLFWGGGHATSHEDDVAHYSVRGGNWTIGYHPDDPIEQVYATQPTPLSFQNRVHVPIHAYRAYCYDPTARKMFFLDRAYDPYAREWDEQAILGLEHRGPMGSQMEATPQGAVTYSEKGLFRYDASAGRWQKLPWEGASFGKMWCDGYGLCYDSKRDCLWLANDKEIVRYDFETGKATQLEVNKPAALGKFMLWSEQVYLPESDLILLMRLFDRGGRLANVAWSPAEGKYYWLELPFVEQGKPVRFDESPFGWSDALRFDPQLKLVLLNHSKARKVWALPFDGASAKLEEISE